MASLAERLRYAWRVITAREPIASDLERKQLVSILARLAALEAAQATPVDLSPIQAEIDALKAAQPASVDLSGVEAEIAAVKDACTAHDAAIADVSDKVTSLGNDLDTLSNDVSKIHDEIGDAAPPAAA